MAATGGHGGDGEGGDLEFVDLGGMKRVSISRYGGRLSVDLREYYQVRPGWRWWWGGEERSVGQGSWGHSLQGWHPGQRLSEVLAVGRSVGNALYPRVQLKASGRTLGSRGCLTKHASCLFAVR